MRRQLIVTIGSVSAFAGLVAGAYFGGTAWRDARTAAEQEPAGIAYVIDAGGFAEPTSTPTPEPVVTPEPAPPAPVVTAPVEDSGPAPGASGSLVPFIPSDDPQNANGGDYIDPGIFCDSHSASTINGEVVCD